nr:MAG TPA_asm: hypothetical protein [Caudoviricetes sp.]
MQLSNINHFVFKGWGDIASPLLYFIYTKGR